MSQSEIMWGMMGYLIGLGYIIAGLAVYAVAIIAVIAWWTFCFGTVFIGVLLLIFMPYVLAAPFAIFLPGTVLIFLGWEKMNGVLEEYNKITIKKNKKINLSNAILMAEREIISSENNKIEYLEKIRTNNLVIGTFGAKLPSLENIKPKIKEVTKQELVLLGFEQSVIMKNYELINESVDRLHDSLIDTIPVARKRAEDKSSSIAQLS